MGFHTIGSYHIHRDETHRWVSLYFDTKLSRKRLSFPFSKAIAYILPAFYFGFAILWIIHCLAKCFSLKQSRQKKLITFRTEDFYFLCCCQARFSWLLLPDFLVAASAASSDVASRSCFLFELVIRKFALRLTYWFFLWTRVELLIWYTKQ